MKLERDTVRVELESRPWWNVPVVIALPNETIKYAINIVGKPCFDPIMMNVAGRQKSNIINTR